MEQVEMCSAVNPTSLNCSHSFDVWKANSKQGNWLTILPFKSKPMKIYQPKGAVQESFSVLFPQFCPEPENELNKKWEGKMVALFCCFIHEGRSTFGTTRSHNLLRNKVGNPNNTCTTIVEWILLVQLFSIESYANQNACYNKRPIRSASTRLGVQRWAN